MGKFKYQWVKKLKKNINIAKILTYIFETTIFFRR